MSGLDHIISANLEWAGSQSAEDLARWQAGQSPKILWIGCSDSRVPPEQITRRTLGEIFVHRNIGNLVLPNDASALSVLYYAIRALKVEHVVVCGHYECGAMKAVLGGRNGRNLDILEHWLVQAEDVMQKHQSELSALDDKAKWRRLAELNAIESARVVTNTKMFRDALADGQKCQVHAMTFDIGSGKLIDLGFKQ